MGTRHFARSVPVAVCSAIGGDPARRRRFFDERNFVAPRRIFKHLKNK
jgi:hypothetical protein